MEAGVWQEGLGPTWSILLSMVIAYDLVKWRGRGAGLMAMCCSEPGMSSSMSAAVGTHGGEECPGRAPRASALTQHELHTGFSVPGLHSHLLGC